MYVQSYRLHKYENYANVQIDYLGAFRFRP